MLARVQFIRVGLEIGLPLWGTTAGVTHGLLAGVDIYNYHRINSPGYMQKSTNTWQQVSPPNRWQHIILPTVVYGSMGFFSGKLASKVVSSVVKNVIEKNITKQAAKKR